MADVFISYKREERQAVERLAQELCRLGLDVWFDASLNAGEAFSDEIDREAHAAKAILVCWSPAARESKWVKAEALIGFEHGKLAACYVAGPNGFYPPAPFNSIHVEDLRGWVAAPLNTNAGYRSVLRRIGALCGRADIESFGGLDLQAPASVLRAWISSHARSPLFTSVDELLRVRDAEESERAQLEQEAREHSAPEETKRWERENGGRQDRARHEKERRKRDARSIRRIPWALITGGVVLAAFTIGIMLSGRQQEIPLPEMVRIPGRNLEVGRYEVTFAEWDACVAAGGCGHLSSGFEEYRANDEGWGRGNRPVINVSVDDAAEYLRWLSERTGEDYRLLTVAEWQYVARAGTTTTYYWGDDSPVCDRGARNGANVSICPEDRTQPVGSFPPNGYGVYDIYGNVWEWSADCNDDEACTTLSIVGSSWYNDFSQQDSHVGWAYHDQRDSALGFRVARTLRAISP